jgi:succinoglycan biosynthesis transport protein ExoP
MSRSTSFHLTDLVRVLLDYPKRWLVPAAVVVVLCGLYAVCKPRIWQASQTLLVRNDAANSETASGRFRDVEEMKVTQETILEMCKSQRVLEGALQEVSEAGSGAWPSLEEVADLRDAVTLNAPSGIEFGKTEISYLNVHDRDRQRAMALAAAVSKHLEAGVRRLRDSKAQSMVAELSKTVGVAEAEMADATGRLANIEQEVGADLSDLRNMELSATGDSDLRRRLNSIEDELRLARVDRQTNEELRKLLLASQNDAGHLVATPGRLLSSQPALQRLKEGLVAAQLKTSQLSGHLTAAHPSVVAAREEEREIAQHLHRELAVAVRGVEVDLRLANERLGSLEVQRADLDARLERLAALRPKYSAVLAEVKQRNEVLAEARRKLSVARSAQAAAQSASVITFVDTPVVGNHPVGPSRATILLFGLIGGLAIGFGVLFLTVPGMQQIEEEAPIASQAWPGLDKRLMPAGKSLEAL